MNLNDRQVYILLLIIDDKERHCVLCALTSSHWPLHLWEDKRRFLEDYQKSQSPAIRFRSTEQVRCKPYETFEMNAWQQRNLNKKKYLTKKNRDKFMLIWFWTNLFSSFGLCLLCLFTVARCVWTGHKLMSDDESIH